VPDREGHTLSGNLSVSVEKLLERERKHIGKIEVHFSSVLNLHDLFLLFLERNKDADAPCGEKSQLFQNCAALIQLETERRCNFW
jgi:hypothetical protein